MKRRSLWVTSIMCLLVATTFAFQNCNNKKFNATGTAHMSGSLGSMDTGGQIDGEATSSLCDEQHEIDAGNCPESAIIKFYAVSDSGAKTFIDQTEANRVKGSDGKYKYVFSFVVPNEHLCKDIEVYVVDPTTQTEIQITPDSSFILWGDVKQCESFEPKPPTTGNAGSVDIEGFHKDGRLAEVYGKCSGSANVVASGDLNDIINKEDACVSGKFSHCDFLSKNNNTNTVTEKQGSASDSIDIPGGNPILVFTMDTFVKSGKNITITGKCTPGADITFTIYNNPKPTIVCPDNGIYTQVGTNWLVTGLSNRVLFGKLENRYGTVNISADVDSENATLNCAISETVARVDWCTKQAGNVKGTCVTGLPVQLYINGNSQNFTTCVNGAFEFKNVLLQKVGNANEVKIEQRNPYNKSCSAIKSLMQF